MLGSVESVAGGVSAPAKQRSRGPVCQRSRKAPTLGRGRVGADIQFPATSEPGALAWRDGVGGTRDAVGRGSW